MRKQKNIGAWTVYVITLIITALLVTIFLNRQWLYDWYLGLSYEPSPGMAAVREKLNLTDRGDFLFAASHPELNESEEFNRNCRASDTEVAVLGCYTEDVIYVYNITEPELDGIIETTAAHELLHAVFERISDAEKESLKPSLKKVLNDNKDVLQKELDTYAEEEQFEELYVRAGTEIKNLTSDLEKHYAEIFKDQDAVVEFYDGYIKVFRDLQAELDKLEQEIEPLGKQLESDLATYEKELAQLNADIVSFNACVEVTGCFKTNKEFYNRRNVLISAQKRLNKEYDELNKKIEEYNEKIEQYNKDVLRGQDLNRIINSNSRPNEI